MTEPTLIEMAAAYAKRKMSRPGAKAKMGIIDRLGAAASALTGPGVDPTTQAYKTSVSDAKKAAIDEVKNYAFMVKANDQKLAALDAYVKSTSKAIATLNSAPEILRLTDGLRQAVKARSVLMQTLKMPFARKAGKRARFAGNTRDELKKISEQVSAIAKSVDMPFDALVGRLEDAVDQMRGRTDDAAKSILPKAKELIRHLETSRDSASEFAGYWDFDSMAEATKALQRVQALKADLAKSNASVLAMLKAIKESERGADRTSAGQLFKINGDLQMAEEFLSRLLVEWSIRAKNAPDSRKKNLVALRKSMVDLDKQLAAISQRTEDRIDVKTKDAGKIDALIGQAKQDLGKMAALRKEAIRVTGEVQKILEAKGDVNVPEYLKPSTRHTRPGAKSTHAALPPQTLEAERRPGGGSHSEAVSRKIATLINEGKPQDQAVAIALDLERRGEL